jgi:hypothetical protein
MTKRRFRFRARARARAPSPLGGRGWGWGWGAHGARGNLFSLTQIAPQMGRTWGCRGGLSCTTCAPLVFSGRVFSRFPFAFALLPKLHQSVVVFCCPTPSDWGNTAPRPQRWSCAWVQSLFGSSCSRQGDSCSGGRWPRISLECTEPGREPDTGTGIVGSTFPTRLFLVARPVQRWAEHRDGSTFKSRYECPRF